MNTDELGSAEKWALQPFERKGSDNPYAVQHALQDIMQELVGIVRQEQEMLQALERIRELKAASERVSVDWKPGIQCGLAHGARPAQPADRLGNCYAGGAGAERKPRRRISAMIFRPRTSSTAASTSWCEKAPAEKCSSRASPFPPMREDLQQIIQEMK